MRHMVSHLGGYEQRPGRFPNWVYDQSDLRLVATSPGSFTAELSLHSPPEDLFGSPGQGPAALEALMKWDGTENSTLPGVVTDRLLAISSALPSGMRVWLGTDSDRHRVEIRQRSRRAKPAGEHHEAVLQGWLKEVNWERHTAQLHDYAGEFIRLKFHPDLDEEMRLLATGYVEVTGRGQFDKRGAWKAVLVKQVTATRSHNEPFDLEAFLNDPNPRIFDSEKVVTASEPFDVDEFLRVIHEARYVRHKDPSD